MSGTWSVKTIRLGKHGGRIVSTHGKEEKWIHHIKQANKITKRQTKYYIWQKQEYTLAGWEDAFEHFEDARNFAWQNKQVTTTHRIVSTHRHIEKKNEYITLHKQENKMRQKQPHTLVGWEDAFGHCEDARDFACQNNQVTITRGIVPTHRHIEKKNKYITFNKKR